MIKAKVLLGLLAGFTVGTVLGAVFASRGKEKDDKTGDDKKKDRPEREEEEVITF